MREGSKLKEEGRDAKLENGTIRGDWIHKCA